MLAGIDDLKIINIKYGRETGNAIIQSLSEAMAQILPHMEKIFRLNSDVFAALLPYSSADDTNACALYNALNQWRFADLRLKNAIYSLPFLQKLICSASKNRSKPLLSVNSLIIKYNSKYKKKFLGNDESIFKK